MGYREVYFRIQAYAFGYGYGSDSGWSNKADEAAFEDEYRKLFRQLGWELCKVNLVRYADDFIVTAATKEIAEEAKAIIRDLLQTRGLELSEEKTVITHINDGFDMLGWTFRKFKGKLIVKPPKKSLKALKSTLSETILRRGKAWKQEILIEKLNQQIRGWTNYHQSVCASHAFSHIDYILYGQLWRWAKRRHPRKSHGWIASNYWHRKGKDEDSKSTRLRNLHP